MMIPILKDYYAHGYLPGPRPRAIPAYLPNANLAVRRGTLEEVGGYDHACLAGEDADLCTRASRAGWALYFEPEARAWHEGKPTVAALVRQWRWYADGGSHFFFKQQEKRLEVYVNLALAPKLHQYRRVVATRFFPVPAMVFLSPFPLWHLAALAIVVLLVAGFPAAALLLGLSSLLVLGGLFCRSPLRRLAWRDVLLYAGMTCLINWTCMLTSVGAGLKKRRLFFFPGI